MVSILLYIQLINGSSVVVYRICRPSYCQCKVYKENSVGLKIKSTNTIHSIVI